MQAHARADRDRERWVNRSRESIRSRDRSGVAITIERIPLRDPRVHPISELRDSPSLSS